MILLKYKCKVNFVKLPLRFPNTANFTCLCKKIHQLWFKTVNRMEVGRGRGRSIITPVYNDTKIYGPLHSLHPCPTAHQYGYPVSQDTPESNTSRPTSLARTTKHQC